MIVTADLLNKITGHTKYLDRKAALALQLNTRGDDMAKITRPHVLAQFLAQVMHESGAMRYTKEIWGPTRQQLTYEGREGLGNTQRGDGSKFKGYGYIQLTGRYNVTRFDKWIHKEFPDAPNFVASPHLIATSEWLGLAALFYWVHYIDPKYIESGNIEMITRQVNGGLNGYKDRLKYYDRAALAILGFETVLEFQRSTNLKNDGISGPATREMMHKRLKAMDKPKFNPFRFFFDMQARRSDG